MSRSEYIRFTVEGAEFHRNRVRRHTLDPRSSGKHLLKIPLVIVDDEQKIMLNQTDTVNHPSPQASLCLPSFRTGKLSRKVRFTKLVRSRLDTHIFRDFSAVAPSNTVLPLGVYKDYPSGASNEQATVTQLPAMVDLGVNHEDLEIYPNFVKMRGNAIWLPAEEALEELHSERQTRPFAYLDDSITLIGILLSNTRSDMEFA